MADHHSESCFMEIRQNVVVETLQMTIDTLLAIDKQHEILPEDRMEYERILCISNRLIDYPDSRFLGDWLEEVANMIESLNVKGAHSRGNIRYQAKSLRIVAKFVLSMSKAPR